MAADTWQPGDLGEVVNPLADWWGLGTSKAGLGALIGVDLLFNDAELLTTGFGAFGDAADGIGALG